MKQKGLIIATLIFFLLVNTTYYWERNLGVYAMLTFLIMIFYFFILTVLLFRQIFLSLREKFAQKQRLVVIGIMSTVLVLTIFFPNGLVNFSQTERNNVLVAEREGAANCNTILKLKDNHEFIETNVCFGLSETTGTYIIKGDTIHFENVTFGRGENDYFKFAVIQKSENTSDKYLGELVRYKDYSDTTGMSLWITKNELTK